MNFLTGNDRKIIKNRQWQKENREKIKLEAYKHYSKSEIPFCQCCKETEIMFLELDHKNNDGAEHRRAEKSLGPFWAKKHNWPDIFQVLCSNCNFGRKSTVNNFCPHELINGIDMNGNPIDEKYIQQYREKQNFINNCMNTLRKQNGQILDN